MLDLLRTYSDRMEFDGLVENTAKNTQNITNLSHSLKQNNLNQEQLEIKNISLEEITQKILKLIQSNNKNNIIEQTNSALQRINNKTLIILFLSFIFVKKIFIIY